MRPLCREEGGLMPIKLDRCVREVMGKGHSESSAFGVCRSALGLASDGSEDDREVEMADGEIGRAMQKRIEKLRLQELPTLRKEMVVAYPIGHFVNGDQEGQLSKEDLEELVKNFKRYPRQSPVFALGDHPLDLDERPPDGWVEGLRITGDYDLIADVKLIGSTVGMIEEDLIRGASIATVPGFNPDGSEQGIVLHHLLLTNNPFIKGLNVGLDVAARQVVERRDINAGLFRPKGGVQATCYFSEIRREDKMKHSRKGTRLQDEDEDEKKGMQDTEDEKDEMQDGDVEEAPDEMRKKMRKLMERNAQLEDEIEELRTQLANADASPEKEKTLKQIAKLQRKSMAQDIREVVNHGLRAGTLVGHEVYGFAGAGPLDYGGTIRWLKDSKFWDDTTSDPQETAFDRLRFQATKGPVQFRQRQSFRSGGRPGESVPHDDGTVTLTDEQRVGLRALGLDPERISGLSDDCTPEERQSFIERQKREHKTA
jgi:hypothetical protein